MKLLLFDNVSLYLTHHQSCWDLVKTRLYLGIFADCCFLQCCVMRLLAAICTMYTRRPNEKNSLNTVQLIFSNFFVNQFLSNTQAHCYRKVGCSNYQSL